MKKRIGFIGLGAMGKPMALRLLQAGYELLTCVHHNQEPVNELVQQGASSVNSVAELAACADVIITMLPNTPDVEEVCLGPHGIVSGHVDGRELVVIDMSTISPLVTRTLATRLKHAGIVLLDAPVSGGVFRAASGELTIMVGGEAEQVEQQRTLLHVMGTHVIHVGPVGHGQLVKVTNNVIVGMLLPALSEALTLATKAGVQLDILRRVLATSSGGNYLLEHWLPQTLFQQDYTSKFALDLMRKDIGLALELGRDLQVPLPEASLAYQLFMQASGLGYGHQDMTAISKLYQQMADINIVTGEPFTAHA